VGGVRTGPELDAFHVMMDPYKYSSREKYVAAERWMRETFRLTKGTVESVDSYGFRYTIGRDRPRVVTWKGACDGSIGAKT